MKKLIIIAAIGKNRELGYKGKLIWNIKEDMKFFKENTIGHTVLMGDTTFYSLPKMLENRKHLILTFSNDKFPKDVVVLKSIDEFFDIAKEIDDDIYVIGGASIYSQFIDYADEILLTEIQDERKADVFFPKFDKNKYKNEIIDEFNNTISFKFVRYVKR